MKQTQEAPEVTQLLVRQLAELLNQKTEEDYAYWNAGSTTQPPSYSFRLAIKKGESLDEYIARFRTLRDILEAEKQGLVGADLTAYIRAKRERYGKPREIIHHVEQELAKDGIPASTVITDGLEFFNNRQKRRFG